MDTYADKAMPATKSSQWPRPQQQHSSKQTCHNFLALGGVGEALDDGMLWGQQTSGGWSAGLHYPQLMPGLSNMMNELVSGY